MPAFLGTRVLADIPLAELVPFIDWSPFFMTWELKGKYPEIFDDPGRRELSPASSSTTPKPCSDGSSPTSS